VGNDIYAQRLATFGEPLWAKDGMIVCTARDHQQWPVLAPDGSGGAFIAWTDWRSTFAPDWPPDIYAQRVDGNGTPQWTADGVALATGPDHQAWAAIAGEAGSAIVAWSDYQSFNPVTASVRAMRLVSDGPVPTNLALVSAEAGPGSVRLRWYAGGTSNLIASVYRRDVHGGWTRLGIAEADGTGYVTYQDDTVLPGMRYAYRLGVLSNLGEEFTDETWVDVPLEVVFALGGARPNPTPGALSVAFSLPSGAAATLELIDVTGRLVIARDVGSLGPGNHQLLLNETREVAAGVYWLRLRQGDRVLSGKVVVAP
jgi:hypothetical protein